MIYTLIEEEYHLFHVENESEEYVSVDGRGRNIMFFIYYNFKSIVEVFNLLTLHVS